MLALKMNEEVMKIKICMVVLLAVMLSSFVSAGVGIKWDRETALIAEGKEACITYGVYNPWPETTYVEITVTEPLLEVLEIQDTETVEVPQDTASSDAIPIEFCFEAPKRIYSKDCWVGNFFVCEKQCLEEKVVYEGDVVVSSVPNPAGGGSSAVMAVSAPLRVRVDCLPFERDYTMLYALIAVISLGIVGFVLYRRYRTPPAERYKQEMKELRAKIRSEGKKKKK
jgi:hypothetical protein